MKYEKSSLKRNKTLLNKYLLVHVTATNKFVAMKCHCKNNITKKPYSKKNSLRNFNNYLI